MLIWGKYFDGVSFYEKCDVDAVKRSKRGGGLNLRIKGVRYV